MIPVRTDLPTTHDDARVGGWQQIGHGCSRTAFTHQDHPGVVLKVGYYSDDNRTECHVWESAGGSYLQNILVPILARSSCYYAVLMPLVTTGRPKKRHDTWGDAVGYVPERKVSMARGAGIDDLHGGNLACIMDDYGDHVAVRVLDYACVYGPEFPL